MKLSIDHKSPIPLHAQVEELLRKLIDEPEYKDGAFLPKEVDLAKILGISRNTVRQAINKLVFEGLLIRKKGQGTRVAEKVVDTQLDNWLSFTQEMTDKGVALENFLIDVEWVEADEKVANFMEVAEGTRILRLTRLRGHEDGPFVYFESYFHPRVGLTGKEDFTKPLYEILEADCATKVSLSKEKIKARAASSITAKRLGISSGDPVLVRERFVFDPGNRPVEYNVGYYNAYKFVYSIDIRR